MPNFTELQRNWGPFSLDVFASDLNARCVRYFTQERSVFCHSVAGEHVWACPPPRLIIPAIKLFARDQVTGVLCVPLWHSSPFWLSICPDGVHLANFVVDYIVFHPYFIAGPDVVNKTFSAYSAFNMIALYCNFANESPMLPNNSVHFKLEV